PSRARLQLAARLAMNKRNAAAAAANGGEEGSSPTDEGTESSLFNIPSMTASERLRNPFADDEDDEDRSGSGSDDDQLENVEDDGIEGNSGWNRGSWWRGVVSRGAATKKKDDDNQEIERFGDGRDDTDDSDTHLDADDIDDEEFGDFAMAEVGTGGGGGMVSGIDPAREKILVKPMALHPVAVKSSFGSLWPFSNPGFGLKEKKEEGDKTNDAAGSGSSSGGITEEPVELSKEEDDGVIGEDGKKINRAVEATRRTSIEDPDDDEGEEIIVHKATGVH
ncbi:hypothetical protein QBC35DRAFT_389066, partial [Podospora australis]